jgi:hypothetical protein
VGFFITADDNQILIKLASEAGVREVFLGKLLEPFSVKGILEVLKCKGTMLQLV